MRLSAFYHFSFIMVVCPAKNPPVNPGKTPEKIKEKK
jgi:hypothetical protein